MRRPGLGLLLLGLVCAACGYPDVQGSDNAPVATTVQTTPTPVAGADNFGDGAGKAGVKLPDGLQYVDLVVGTGAVVKKNDSISVQYTGWLLNGTKFDSSRDRGQPFDVTIGQGQVIPGWDEAVPGMKVGGRRRLVIPPELAYGAQGQQPTIPPNSTLVFIVEVATDNGPAAATPTPSP